ncbi:transcriptional regulator [Desertimonas flava]|uniref:transcriptional regulator n=1 Tax=Desertimonas flava TaxID=2064846 RepID=UPI000E355316|nr:transcriptional regulator [Desertimonas flava]
MYSDAIVAQALALERTGRSPDSIASELGISRTTVVAWLRVGSSLVAERGASRLGRPTYRGECIDPASLDPSAYAYLLGQYLGDGCISAVKRSFRLRITCCDDYPGVMDECELAIVTVRPEAQVRRLPRTGCTELSDSWHHWPCLLPHGRGGVKHTRLIELTEWQRHLALEAAPGQFVRGLIHSDGWRGTNRVRGANGKTYEYPRYLFSNRSADIRQLFVDGCERISVGTRRMNAWTVSVAKRADVAILDQVVGPKC